MPLGSVDRVRTLIGDMNKSAIREAVANGDGATTLFQLDMFPVRTGSLSFFKSGTAVGSAVVNLVLGTVDVTGSAPLAGDRLVADYQYNALSDQEIEFYIDLASAAGAILAASYAARGLAGNYARFFAYTQGDKSVDKDSLSDKLLRLAESFEDAAASKLAGFAFTPTTFDDSGTPFDGYQTASANPPTDTRYWWNY